MTEDFLSGGIYDRNMTHYMVNGSLAIGFDDFSLGDENDYLTHNYFSSYVDKLQASVTQMENLTNEECIHKYPTRLLTGRRNILAVTTSENSSQAIYPNDVRNGNLLFVNPVQLSTYALDYSAYDPFIIFCSGLDDYTTGRMTKCTSNMVNPVLWNLLGFPIQYCLSEIVEGRC